MCSILGGTALDEYSLKTYLLAKDRGRDYTGLAQRGKHWVANHRATPTNELESPVRNQPFNHGDFSIVHNGTIANDKELGLPDGAIDSEILTRVLDMNSFELFVMSLQKVKGSFAIAAVSEDAIWLACNYKPIFYCYFDDEWTFSSLEQHMPWFERETLMKPTRLAPYTAISLIDGQRATLKRTQPDSALVVCSGGLDSTAVTGYAKMRHSEIRLLHFDYDCRATEKELEAIQNIALSLDCGYEVLKLDYSKYKGSSTLFQDEQVTTGEAGVEYALDWVYARNTVMLAAATAYAEANNYGHIYLGTNLEESGAYPDNEYQYILDMNRVLDSAVNNGYKVEIHAPLGGLMKSEIVTFGNKHKSPIEMSWSCYNGGQQHCGECGPCYMRQKAFHRAGVADPTAYEKPLQYD